MEINGKVHCFFEQSGTFKNEFIKLGIPAEDYDIQNNFGETDHIVDLFSHIEREYDKTRQDKTRQDKTRQDKTRQDKTRQDKTIFDDITKDDLIMAFFPCIEFSCVAQMWFSLSHKDFRKWDDRKKVEYIITKNRKRAVMFELLIKFCSICLTKKIRMIFENPWSENTYLKQNVFLKKPTLIDHNRTRRGDFFVKPTAYWFWNCEPSNGFTYQPTPNEKRKKVDKMKKAPHAGLCSEERSMISPDYARNWICDFILGKKQDIGQLSLF